MELHLIIKGIRKYLQLSQEDFANRLGMTRSNLSQMEIGRNTPSVALLNDLANIFHIDIRIVFQMINSDENVFLSLLPQLSSDLNKGKENGKERGNVSTDMSLDSRKTKSTPFEKEETKDSLFLPDSGKTKSTNIVELPVPVTDESEMVSVPLVDISVAAGSGYYNPDQLSEIDCIRFPKSMVKEGRTYLCVRIKGESMVPTLQDGGYLVIRLLERYEWQDVRDGHVYVISDTDGRAFVKRLKNRLSDFGFIVCMSDNPDVTHYRNFNLMENEINTIWHAEWYISAKMPNIHTTYYNKVSELEDKYDDVITQLQQVQREIRALSQPS